MRGFDLVANKPFDGNIPDYSKDSRLVVVCNSGELYSLLEVFNWDKDTVDECSNLDEKIRFTNYEGYDFISLIYAESEGFTVKQQEVNIFFSSCYLALVLPENPSASLSNLADRLLSAIPNSLTRPSPLAHLYYVIFDNLASYYTDSLEKLEDKIEALSEAIESSPDKEQIKGIVPLRKMTYTYKKLLRALSYVGDQVLMDEHEFLDSSQHRYFRDIDTRLSKLFDFADSLYVSSNDLLSLQESKASAQMNATINRLTMITLFFAPPTLIAGIYGMNFINMPELSWYFGYPIALVLMLSVSTLIYAILKKNKWL
ncbi:MAG: magnesium transporter CorA family protein [Oscillospiraceae bacterium]|nr:magnesium transporter CorA family protein [Oscillospiraceae bacterium]MCL2280016.1 magnesium transporter CorA family protein [Oscillospiraceae bacterium]